MLTLTLNWTEKAETVVSAKLTWSPAAQMQEQIRTHQVLNQTTIASSLFYCHQIF